MAEVLASPADLGCPRFHAIATPHVSERPLASRSVAFGVRAAHCAAPTKEPKTAGKLFLFAVLASNAPDTIRTGDLGGASTTKLATQCDLAANVGRSGRLWGSPQGNQSAPDTIRTYDLGFRKALLYPAELRGRGGGA